MRFWCMRASGCGVVCAILALVLAPWGGSVHAETQHSAASEASLASTDVVMMASGQYAAELPLFSLGGPMDLDLELRYRSDLIRETWPGIESRFWWSPLEAFTRDEPANPSNAFVTVQIRNGDTITFKKRNEDWVPTENGDFGFAQNVYPARWSLKGTGDYLYCCDPIRQEVHTFEVTDAYGGRIRRIEDRNGNALIYSYASTTDCCPSRIEDGLGRYIDLTYEWMGANPAFLALVKATDQAGRHVDFTHELAGADNGNSRTLRSVSDASGSTNRFSYQPYNYITGMTRPGGNTPYTQTYSNVLLAGKTRARVVSQMDAYSNTTTFNYDSGSNRVTMTHPDATAVVYEHYGEDVFPKALTDPTGKAMAFRWDETNNRPTSVTDRIGDTTSFTYETNTGLIASYTDAEGQTTTYTYAPQDQPFTNPLNLETVSFTFHNLTRVTYADSTHDDYSCNAAGHVLAFSNRLGKAWRFTYNTRGQVLTRSNPTGGTNTFTYHPDGTLASSTDSDAGSGTNTYSYDACKRLSAITRPGSHTRRFAYDNNNRLLALVDERGKTNTFIYDGNGNLAGTRNPLLQTYTNAYDQLDRLDRVTDPQSNTATRAYDAMNRLASISDRNSNTTTFTYNSRGWRTGVTDAEGNAWTAAYDDEGVPASRTSPLGFTTSFQTDNRGRITRVTDALGQHTHFAYDSLGRLISTTDRLGRAMGYAYDASGMLTNVRNSVLGAASYVRDGLGNLTRMTDLLGKNWDFGYSAMGRLTSQTDPLGRQRTYAYDSRGRVAGVTYPGGSGTAAYTYDAANNVTQIVHSVGPTLVFKYDDAGRLISANDIALAYDTRGDITNSQDGAAAFGATYDRGRRLKTATYDGLATVTYTYDARNVLTRVEDNLAGAWLAFSHDGDGRLTRIQRSNGVITDFTYDNAGRVTRIQDGALGDQQYTLNAEGDPTRVTRNLPLVSPFTSATRNLTYDNAAQISSAGYSYDNRGRQTMAPGATYAYDGADRLTMVSSGNSTSIFTYNGLGAIRTRTAGGSHTTYFHNYALGLDPIVAEKDGASYKRFYVYTPVGQLLYSIDTATAQARFYHFNRMGSVLFLSDSAGAVSDAYAHDPYGNLLARIGTNDQPFTYIGQYGVRHEPIGALYDMRARAYDPATARFLSRDPVWPVLADLEGLNPYQYAYENPLRYVDPQGRKVDWSKYTFDPPPAGTPLNWSTMSVGELMYRYMWYEAGEENKKEREAAAKELRRRGLIRESDDSGQAATDKWLPQQQFTGLELDEADMPELDSIATDEWLQQQQFTAPSPEEIQEQQLGVIATDEWLQQQQFTALAPDEVDMQQLGSIATDEWLQQQQFTAPSPGEVQVQ